MCGCANLKLMIDTMQIRFRIREINFTGLTTSAKGVTATVTSESHETKTVKTEKMLGGNAAAVAVPTTVRRRSSSMGLASDDEVPSAMQLVGCINDFGLGLVAWW